MASRVQSRDELNFVFISRRRLSRSRTLARNEGAKARSSDFSRFVIGNNPEIATIYVPYHFAIMRRRRLAGFRERSSAIHGSRGINRRPPSDVQLKQHYRVDAKESQDIDSCINFVGNRLASARLFIFRSLDLGTDAPPRSSDSSGSGENALGIQTNPRILFS